MLKDKEGEGFYQSLSRKELQSLCKKYGLPARKPNSEMAQSLFSFFQRRELSLISSFKSKNGTYEDLLTPSPLTTFQAQPPLNLTDYIIKDSFLPISCARVEGNHGNTSVTCNELERCLGVGAYNQGSSQPLFISQCAGTGVIHKEPLSSVSGRVENATQCCCGNVNTSFCSQDNIFPAIRSYSKSPATFQFYVNSEEGIKLSVDLTSSPTDWIKKYNIPISLSNNVSNTKAHSLHENLGCTGERSKQMGSSFPVIVDPGEINDGCAHVEPSPSWVLEKNNLGIDLLDGQNKTSKLSPERQCTVVRVEVSECLEEEQGPIVSKPRDSSSKNGSSASSDVQKQIIPNTESCTKNGSSATLDSDLTDTPIEKVACNFFGTSISDGSVDLTALRCPNSKHDDRIWENLNVQKCNNLENDSIVLPGGKASYSTEMQLSEAGNYYKDTLCSPNKSDKLLDLDDLKHKNTKQVALTTSSENDRCGSQLPACSEEREGCNIANGRESSVCSQVDNLDEKTCSKSENLESIEEFCKKRSLIDSEGQNSYSKRGAKILRSMKDSIGEVILRRSMRLVSK